MSLFTAYLDDSGNHDGAKSLVIAGFLGLTIDWVDFEILWANLLNRYALTHVRGTKLASFRGEFETWNAKKRQRFVEDMVQTLNVAGLLGIAATLDERVFKEVFPQATIALADKAFGLLFRLLALKMCSRVGCGDGEISFVLEDGSKDDSDAKRVFESLKTRKSDPLARKLGTFAVALKKAFGALQAADFLAYNAYRNMDAIRSGAVVHETFGQLLRLGHPKLMVVELNRELLEGCRDQAAARLLQLAGA